jgi:uncharacterized protein (DUF2235 family)
VAVSAHSIRNNKQTGLTWSLGHAENFHIGKQRILIACAPQAGTLRGAHQQLPKSYRRWELPAAAGCGLLELQRLRLRTWRALPPLSKTT